MSLDHFRVGVDPSGAGGWIIPSRSAKLYHRYLPYLMRSLLNLDNRLVHSDAA
jgi:hypothetical protein